MRIGMLYREGSHFYKGVEHQQTEPAFDVLKKIIVENSVSQIIEIGTGMGGCTVFLSELAPILTYDIVDRTKKQLTNIYRIDFRIQDVFDVHVMSAIVDTINRSKTTFLMCDGEAKAKEIKIFAPLLKPGDLVFCHDWEDQFGWDDVKETVGTDEYEPVEKELCDTNKTNLQGWRKK
jgi:cephalosporin hydroxylase